MKSKYQKLSPKQYEKTIADLKMELTRHIVNEFAECHTLSKRDYPFYGIKVKTYRGECHVMIDFEVALEISKDDEDNDKKDEDEDEY